MYNDTYYMPDDLKQNNRDKIYIWISEPTNGEKYLMVVNNVFYLSCNRWYRGVIQSKRKMTRRESILQRKLGIQFWRGIELAGRNGCIILGGLLIPIFQAYTLDNFLLDTQLSLDLGWYLVLDALLSYIVMLIYEALVLY